MARTAEEFWAPSLAAREELLAKLLAEANANALPPSEQCDSAVRFHNPGGFWHGEEIRCGLRRGHDRAYRDGTAPDHCVPSGVFRWQSDDSCAYRIPADRRDTAAAVSA